MSKETQACHGRSTSALSGLSGSVGVRSVFSALIADDCFQWAQRKHRALLATSYECDGTERHCFLLAAWRRVRSDRGRAGSTTHNQASWGSASDPTRQYGECHAQKPYRCQLSKLGGPNHPDTCFDAMRWFTDCEPVAPECRGAGARPVPEFPERANGVGLRLRLGEGEGNPRAVGLGD
jgi:hypothetical protein